MINLKIHKVPGSRQDQIRNIKKLFKCFNYKEAKEILDTLPRILFIDLDQVEIIKDLFYNGYVFEISPTYLDGSWWGQSRGSGIVTEEMLWKPLPLP